MKISKIKEIYKDYLRFQCLEFTKEALSEDTILKLKSEIKYTNEEHLIAFPQYELFFMRKIYGKLIRHGYIEESSKLSSYNEESSIIKVDNLGFDTLSIIEDIDSVIKFKWESRILSRAIKNNINTQNKKRTRL